MYLVGYCVCCDVAFVYRGFYFCISLHYLIDGQMVFASFSSVFECSRLEFLIRYSLVWRF